ncbi:pectinesterase family protein [Streptomyces phaeochromogenes]|uniref:pectinesterase family protein n=1 Tax=Streptomyces phaeochromogenes TaxID=1923 RepID=UPI003715A8E7
MSERRGKTTAGPRHRRRRTALTVGIPLALTAAVTTTYGTGLGVFGEGAGQMASAATSASTAAAAPAWAADTADGFASVNSLGQNGTYGGRGGQTVTVKTLADLEKYATAEEPYVIVVAAAITMNPVGKEIKVKSDKTIVGQGTSGQIVGGGFFLGTGVHNVIIRNLTIRDSYQGIWNDKDHDFDAVQMDGAHHVWIDHNDLRHMADGLIDVRKDSTNVTVSWNKFSDNNKTFGIGWTENLVTDITIHHNWFRETEQRNPSTDNAAHAHLYNNYLQDDPGTTIKSSYGNYSRGSTKMVLENSYFQGMNNPVTKDATATIVQRGNTFSGTSGRNESGGTAFDPKSFYGYTLDKAADVPALLTAGTGPRTTIGTAIGTAGVATTKTTTTAATGAAATTLTVAKDGSGQYATVQAAVDAVPANNPSRVVISVKPGTYRETVKVPANKPHVTVQGAGASRKDTVIVFNNAAGTAKPGGGTYGTSGSATVAVEADDFQARNLTINNDFDEARNQGLSGHQAVALRTAADQVLLDGIIVDGDQDTLLLDTAAKDRLGRVYVTNSYVSGNVDFVFGRATAVIDQSVITLKKRWDGTSAGYITAPSTTADRKGILINRSVVNGDVSTGSFFLGRNWHAGGDATLRPQTTVRNSTLSAAVKSTPWSDMGGFSWKNDRFAEYKNTGPGSGAASSDRPQLTDSQASGQEVADWLGTWNPTA